MGFIGCYLGALGICYLLLSAAVPHEALSRRREQPFDARQPVPFSVAFFQQSSSIVYGVPWLGYFNGAPVTPGRSPALCRDANLRLRRRRRLDGRRLAVGQHIHDAALVEIADNRRVTVVALLRPVVDPDDARCRTLLRRARAHHPQQRVLAYRKQKPTRETLPWTANARPR
jgi:hypothetical protein